MKQEGCVCVGGGVLFAVGEESNFKFNNTGRIGKYKKTEQFVCIKA